MGCWNSREPQPAEPRPPLRPEARESSLKGLQPIPSDLRTSAATVPRASPKPAARSTPLSGPTSRAGSSQEACSCPRNSSLQPPDVTIEEVQQNLNKWQAQILHPTIPMSPFSSGTPSSRALRLRAGSMDEEAAAAAPQCRSGTPSSKGLKFPAGSLAEEPVYLPTHEEIVKQLECLELQISSHGTSLAGSAPVSRLPSRKNTQRTISSEERLKSRPSSTVKIQNLATIPSDQREKG